VGGSQLSDVENDTKFRICDPCENCEWARFLDQLSFTYYRTLRNTFDDHQLRGCWARCIDKKNKEKKVHQYSL